MRRKEAVLLDGRLHFLSPTEQRRMQSFIQTIQSERRASDVYIRGIVWWGRVRSRRNASTWRSGFLGKLKTSYCFAVEVPIRNDIIRDERLDSEAS